MLSLPMVPIILTVKTDDYKINDFLYIKPKIIITTFLLTVANTLLAQTIWHNPMNEPIPAVCSRAWNEEIGTS